MRWVVINISVTVMLAASEGYPDHGDQRACQRGERRAQCLRQDDAADDLQMAHADALAGLELARGTDSSAARIVSAP